MEFSKINLITFITLQAILMMIITPTIHGRYIGDKTPAVKPSPSKNNIFRAYIGSDFQNVAFSNVPISSDVEFHFILAFAIDYTTTNHPSPTNGNFNIFWDNETLTPEEVFAVKNKHKNVKVVLSIGGDSCRDEKVFFTAKDMSLWVSNAVSSLTKIVKDYHLDGIDVDYEHFHVSTITFARAIGQVISQLKRNGVISIASIAPFDDEDVQSHYQALWKGYGHLFDYVNFQFYAYEKDTTVSQFIGYFEEQSVNYKGGKIIASFATDGISGGLSPENGFFEACKKLKSKGKLAGIFVWSADSSKPAGFPHEKQSQALLASDHNMQDY